MNDTSAATAKLAALSTLVGEWVLGDPAAPVGRTSFSWLAGRRFLVQHWTVEIPEAPDGIAIYGIDESSGGLVQHSFDSRGVARIYEMTLEDRTWTLWRSGADFSQRFTSTISPDGSTSTGRWESGPPHASPDDTSLTHDFDLTYTKVS